VAAIIYGYGHPLFDGLRPSSIDAPLQIFHNEVTQAALDGARVVITIDESRAARYVKNRLDVTEQRIKSGTVQ
jgi:hypothetical protein